MAEKEYIERNAVIAELQEEIEFETAMYTAEQNDYFNRGLKCALKDVRRHPAADVVQRLKEYNIKYLRTDLNRSIRLTFNSNKNTYAVTTERGFFK